VGARKGLLRGSLGGCGKGCCFLRRGSGLAADGFWDDDLNVGEVVADHLLVVALHLVGHHEVVSFGVVGLAVVPDQLDVVQHLLHCSVLARLQLLLYAAEVHRMLDDVRVVQQFEF
jgi:hypothetical protein